MAAAGGAGGPSKMPAGFSMRGELRGAAESARYVPRDDRFMEKHGSAAAGTHAAHKLSWELKHYVDVHTAGRPVADGAALARAMGAESNLRIKSAHGNTVLDAKRDERIGYAIVHGGGALHERSTAERAHQAYLAGMASGHASMAATAAAIGDLTLRTGRPGRPVMVRNLHKP
jgi:hypothetical protein